MKRTCKQCGAEFMLSENEIAFYRNKNLHLPKRCENCRRENRKTDGDSAVRQEIKPYYKKDGNKIGRLAAAAAVCLLLAVVIGAFRAGWLFEAAWSGQGDGVSAETVADASVAVDTTPESPEKMDETPPVVPGEMDDAPPRILDEVDDTPPVVPDEADNAPPEISAKVDDAPVDVAQDAPQQTPEDLQTSKTVSAGHTYSFRRAEYLQEHFEKHGAEFPYASADEYLAGANRVVTSPEALHKLEAEDGDDVYYLESTNEFVIVATDGYIRTYFKPDEGKAYYDRQ